MPVAGQAFILITFFDPKRITTMPGMELLSEMESKLTIIEQNELNLIKRAELSINVINNCIDLLKAFISKNKFSSPDEEIHFFKEVKPLFLSKQIYYIKVFNIEIKIPKGGEKVKRKYLQVELDKLKLFFDNNVEFYSYYRACSTYFDHKYFIRGKRDIHFHLDSFRLEADPKFSTGYDYKVAKILANDLLQVYLEEKLNNIKKNETPIISQVVPNIELTWSESKTALVEIIYALHSQGAIENGKADLKDIASCFEKAFNVDLGNYYRTFLEIKERKYERSKFLDNLRSSFLQRLEDEPNF